MGFTQIEGVDLSPALVANYHGSATVYVADCRKLPFSNGTKDIAIVQGGLHHLPMLPDDLEKTLSEIDRVLRPGGRFVAVEPWLTPFLSLIHALSSSSFVRSCSKKMDAFAAMTDEERPTYENWLSRAGEILPMLQSRFQTERLYIRFGKIGFCGIKH
jgi:ubiquinone/menaquinone biosynthesis C-methylase UbiE